MLSGESDFMLKCIARDLPGFQNFVLDELTSAPNVAGRQNLPDDPTDQAGAGRSDRSGRSRRNLSGRTGLGDRR